MGCRDKMGHLTRPAQDYRKRKSKWGWDLDMFCRLASSLIPEPQVFMVCGR